MFNKELAKSVHPEAVDQIIKALAVTKKGVLILEKLLKGEHYTAANEVIPEVMVSVVDFESGLSQLRDESRKYLDEMIAARENAQKAQREAFEQMLQEKQIQPEGSLGPKDEGVPNPEAGDNPEA